MVRLHITTFLFIQEFTRRSRTLELFCGCVYPHHRLLFIHSFDELLQRPWAVHLEPQQTNKFQVCNYILGSLRGEIRVLHLIIVIFTCYSVGQELLAF